MLSEDVSADRDFPPFDRVMMDGIGINAAQCAKGQTQFAIEGLQAAGAPQMELKDPLNCLEVMTGAILPIGVDTIIPYEQITIDSQLARLNDLSYTPGKHVHRQGFDQKEGDVLILAGTMLSSAEIPILATVGI